MVVPSKTTLSDSKTICTYIPFTFIVTNAGPALELGFNDVTYPSGYERVVRIGKEQLDNLKSNSYILHVPVQSFKDKNGNTSNKLVFVGGLTLSATSDPSITVSSQAVAALEVTDGGTRAAVDADHMYLALNFAGAAIDFHEGFVSCEHPVL